MSGNCRTSVIEFFGVFKPKTQRITKANKEVLNRDVVYNFKKNFNPIPPPPL